VVNEQASLGLTSRYVQEQDFKQDVGVVSLVIHVRGIQEVHARGTGRDPQGRPARH